MKILVIGLDGAVPELLFGDEGLTNSHHLLEFGCYGWLESDSPLTTEQAWLCILMGQDLNVGRGVPIWDPVVRQGKRAIITGWLPFEPPHSEGLIIRPFEDESVDDEHSRTAGKGGLKDQLHHTSREQFEAAQHLLQTEAWDYFQFIETTPGRIRRVFGQDHDLQQIALREYYQHLDAWLGNILETLGNDTLLLVSTIQGMQSEGHKPQGKGSSVQLGFFVLAAPNSPLSGEIEGTRLIYIAPTLLNLGGYDIPDSMQGRSLVSGMVLAEVSGSGLTADDEEILRERLSGLGYIS